MPSGYTADLTIDSDFATFAQTCARAFGALIEQRDEKLSAVLKEPELSDYSQKALQRAQVELRSLLALTPEQAAKECAQANTDAQDRYQQRVAREDATAQAYRAMLVKVAAWQPPTAEHQGLKRFMREQLTESLDFDCGLARTKPVPLAWVEWLQQAIAKAKKDIDYHTQQWKEEQKRHAERVQWIRALNTSLGLAAGDGGG